MSRLDNPFAGIVVRPGVPSEDADDPFAGVHVRPPAELDAATTRIPKLHEYMGVEPAESPEVAQGQALTALESGKVGEYAGYLRSEWAAMRPGTPGRADLYRNLRALEQEDDRFQREVLPAIQRRRELDAAVAQRMKEGGLAETEFKFGLTPAGQALMRVQMGVQSAITAPLELGSQIFGSGELAAGIQNEREFRRHYLDLIESHGDVKEILGDTAAKVYNGAFETWGSVALPVKMAGPRFATPAAYTAVATQGMARGLEEAKQLGLEEGEAFQHATLQTGWELAMMGFMGRIAKGAGFDTLEEALSRRGQAVMRAIGEKVGVREFVTGLGKTLGGAGFEMTEEFLTDLGQQIVAQHSDPSRPTDWENAFVAGLTGFASRVGQATADSVKAQDEARKFVKQFAEEKINPNLPFIVDTMRGAADAEAALAATTVSTQPFEAESLGPVDVTESAPTETTDVRSAAIDTALETFRSPGVQTAVQEGEGEANVAEPATYPEGIDAALQRAQAEEFARTADPEKLAKLLQISTTIAPQTEVTSEELTPRVPELHRPSQLAVAEPSTAETTVEETPVDGAVTSQTDTTQANFTELTGIEGASLAYQDAFTDTLAAYVQDLNQPAVPDVPQEPVPAHRTREQIRIAARDKKIAHQRQAIDRLRREVRQARETRQDWFDDAALLIQSAVPPDHQGSFIDALRSVNSPSKFTRLLDRVDRWVARDDYANAWVAYDDAQREATGLRQDWQKLADANKIGMKLKRADLSKMDTPAINAAIDDLNRLTTNLSEAAYKSATDNIMLNADLAVAESQVSGEIVDQTGRSKKLHMTTAPSGLRGFIPKWLRNPDWEEDPKRRIVHNPFLPDAWLDSPITRELATRPEALLAKASPKLRELLWERLLVDGAYARDAMISDLSGQLDGVLQNLGLTWRGGTSLATVGGETTSRLERWREAYQEVGGTRMSRGEALLLHINMRDPQSAAKLREEGGVLSHRKRRVFGPVDEQFESELANFIGNEGIAIADHIFEKINNDVIDPVNAAEELLYGRPLTTNKNMFPRNVDDEEIELKSDKFGERWRAGVTDSYGHLKERQDHAKKLEIVGDAIDFYMRHVEKMAAYAAFAVPHRDAMKVLGQQSVKDSLRAHGGDVFYDMILDRVNRQVAPERVPRSKGDHMLNATTKTIAASRLALREGPILKQALAVPMLAAHVDPGVMSAALKRVQQDRAAIRQRMLDNPFAKQRFSPNKYAHEFTQGMVANVGYFRPTPVTDRLLSPMTIAERESTGVLKQAIAEETVARRMAVTNPYDTDARPANFTDEVNKEWFRLTLRAENNAEGMELNSLQAYGRDHAFAAPLVMFSSSMGRAYTTLAQGLDELREGKFSSGGKKVAAVATAVIAEAMVDDLLSWEDVPGDWVERIAKRTAVGLAGLNVATRDILTRLARSVLGMQVYSDDPIPQAGLIEDVGQITSQTINSITDDTKDGGDKVVAALHRLAKSLIPGYAGVANVGRKVSEGAPLPGLAKDLGSEWEYK